MYREQEYTNKLLDLLQQKHISNLNYRYSLIMTAKIKKEYERLKYDKHIIAGCEELVGNRLGNIIPLHAMLYRLMRKDFGLNENDIYVEMAIDYTLLGCVLDKLIDSKETINRNQYVTFLEEFSLGENKKENQGNILYDMWGRIDWTYLQNVERFSRIDLAIRDYSQRATNSELFSATHTIYSKNVKKEQASDKADKFTIAGSLMALIDIPDERLDELIECANDIGMILLLADDLVDFYNDIYEEKLSSLVLNESSGELHVNHLIDRVMEALPEYVEILHNCLERLKNHLSKETMDFLRYIVNCWITDIKKVEEVSAE